MRVLTADEIALQAWVSRTLTPLGLTACIFAGQGGTAPDPPYATLMVLSDTGRGHGEQVDVYDSDTDTLTRYIRQRRRGTVFIMVIGNAPGVSQMDLARRLEASIDDAVEAGVAGLQGLSVIGVVSGPNRLYRDADGTYSDRVVIDFSYLFNRDVPLGPAESEFIEHPGITPDLSS